jgi:adenine deaminase
VKRADLIRVARGDEPADLVLTNARVVNVLTNEVIETDLAIAGSLIAGLGTYEGREVVDMGGAYLAPGLIEAHVHIESSMVTPSQYARAVVPRGTTTVVTDPHEIANVMGLDGIQLMLDDSEGGALSVFVMASSCVPATHMETSGASLSAEDLIQLRDHPRVLGLAEVMNFPGVVYGDEDVLAKLDAFDGLVIDGHAPGLSGLALNAYVAAGIGSDHECTTADEAREKLLLGMTVFLREATNARNLRALLPAVTDATRDRVCLCTDDRQPADLIDEGHIDHLVRLAITEGVDPIAALRMATYNTAVYFRLRDRGAIAPGRRADLIAFRALEEPRPHLVYAGGRLVARDGSMLSDGSTLSGGAGLATEPPNTIHVSWDHVDLRVPVEGRRMRVIGVVPDQLLTEHLVREARTDGGLGGALASSVAHDHHNIVVVGADDASMLAAARRVADLAGGMVVADGARILAEVPLPLAGLMSTASIEVVRDQVDAALDAARSLGTPLHDPFMALSFLALEVIPSLKLTDRGLVDVDAFEIVPLWVR